MKLYHGTHASALDSIKRTGIAPRAKAKGRNNWKHTVTSNKDAVYLTDAYAWHFAHHATRKDERGLILEIDRDFLLPWKLCPDEDVLEQCTRNQGPTPESPNLAPIEWDMKKRTLFYRKSAKHNPQHADTSLTAMGTAAYYGTIPWSAVTRYVVIDWNKIHKSMWMMSVDSMVAVMNYRILADRHRALTKWFFRDPVTIGEIDPFLADDAEIEGDVPDTWKKRGAMLAEALNTTTGLEVVNVKSTQKESTL